MQIDYTSRDFASLKADLIKLINNRTGLQWDPADYNDLGNVLVEAFAYMGDVVNYYIDRAANETAISTAIKRSTLLNFAQLYGYNPSGPKPAAVTVSFTNNGTTAIDLPIGTQVMAPLVYGPYREVFFETTQLLSQLAPGDTQSVTASEGKTVNTDRPDLIDPTYHLPIPVSLGTTDGSANQSFFIFDTNLVTGSLKVYIGQGVAFAPWQYVDSLIEYGPQDHVFTTVLNDDGTTSVLFGDGTNGLVPPTGQLVGAVYKTSSGISGNIVAGTISEVTFIPGNPDTSVLGSIGVTNTYAAFGGADADDLTKLKSKIKASVNTRNRAVTLQDYINLAVQVPGVGKANAVAGSWTSVTVYVQPQDDGTYTPGIVSGSATGAWNDIALAVQSALQEPSLIGTTVTVSPPTYVPVYAKINVLIDGAYKQSTVVINIKKALLSAAGIFSYDNNVFARVISPSAVVAAVYAVEGILSVDVTALNTDNANGLGTITLNPDQVPYITASALTITPTGGHS